MTGRLLGRASDGISSSYFVVPESPGSYLVLGTGSWRKWEPQPPTADAATLRELACSVGLIRYARTTKAADRTSYLELGTLGWRTAAAIDR